MEQFNFGKLQYRLNLGKLNFTVGNGLRFVRTRKVGHLWRLEFAAPAKDSSLHIS
jgi:hypothetical protein